MRWTPGAPHTPSAAVMPRMAHDFPLLFLSITPSPVCSSYSNGVAPGFQNGCPHATRMLHQVGPGVPGMDGQCAAVSTAACNGDSHAEGVAAAQGGRGRGSRGVWAATSALRPARHPVRGLSTPFNHLQLKNSIHPQRTGETEIDSPSSSWTGECCGAFVPQLSLGGGEGGREGAAGLRHYVCSVCSVLLRTLSGRSYLWDQHSVAIMGRGGDPLCWCATPLPFPLELGQRPVWEARGGD